MVEPSVFISYARADARDFAGRLAAELRAHGVKAWLDTAEIEGGAEWLQYLETGITSSHVFIAVRTPGGRQSPWVRRERLFALEKRKPIIPVTLRDCDPDLELIDRQPIDFRHSFEQALPQLVARIAQLADGHVPEPQDRRTLELAYLGRILLEHSIWQDLYTPMAGVAQMRKAKPRAARPQMVTVPNRIEQKFRQRVRESLHPHDAPVETEQREYRDILPAIEHMQQLVILGDPGSGKTTTLWRIAADYAERAKADPSAPLPIFVRLGALRPDQTLDAHIRDNLGELAAHYDALMQERRLVFLLDGLNELPEGNRAQQVADMRALVERCQRDGLMVAVTCRELDYTGALDLGIPQQVRIAPLDPPRIRQFVNGYIKEPPEAGDELFWQLAGGEEVRRTWETWERAGASFELFWTAYEIPREDPNVYGETSSRQNRVWREAVHGNRSMMKLAHNPYMLYMITQVFTEEGEIPQNRGALFRLFVDFLLLEREKLPAPDAEALKKRLADLAYAMQARGEAGTAVSREEALRFLGDAQQLYRAQSANILSGTDKIRFTHQLLQEFFAAHKLDAEMQAGTPATQFWPPEAWWKPQGWEETAILLAGLYNDDCTPVIEWLQDANPELAARCVLESGAHTPEETLRALQARCVQRMTSEPQPQARAVVGRALAKLGDPRPGVGLRADGLPDIDWVEIPAGPFLMGSGKHTVELPAFAISRYPITVAQFAPFVEGDGYTNRRYWTEAGWAWKEENNLTAPRYWNDPKWHIANHPVVGVSWYEVYAYTRWLSAHLGFEVRLPTEAEWEKAARGMDGRIYPYGNTFDASKGNIYETGIGRTSAVGLFSDGASPYGVLDMSGNVWEWCMTKWRGDYSEVEDNDPAGDARWVVRGGSWDDLQSGARAASRLASNPGYRDDLVGFRVVRPPSLKEH